MKELAFSIPVSGIVKIDGDNITIVVNRAETTVRLEPEIGGIGRISLERGKSMFDVVLETARELVREKGANRFTAAELYHKSLERYPAIKRNSFAARIIGSAPDHPSYRHQVTKRDYLSYLGNGQYKLADRYAVEESLAG